MKIGWKIAGGFVGFLVLMFVLQLAGLEWFKFFQPRKENIRREVFEATKSYTHGKIQDLGKYYEEYQSTDNPEDKTAIEAVIKMRYAEFDETKINSATLRSFLIRTRGY